MAELNLKDLKDIVDDNDLDLSARGLVVVPKAVLQLPRVNQIDLGSNRITYIFPDFCKLTRLVKLDLASNKLVILPDTIGNLVNLQHLNLYNNEIEELPLSFAELRSLKWLDLNRNPLNEPLSKAAGTCSDEKECRKAAVNVVRFVKQQKEQVTASLAKQEKVLKKIQTAKEEQKKKVNKQKNYDQRMAQKSEKQAAAQQQASQKESKAPKEHHKKTAAQVPVKKEEPRRSMLGRLIRYILRWVILIGIILFATATYTVVKGCVDGKLVPTSKPLCADLTKLAEFSKPSPKFATNIHTTYSHIYENYKKAAAPFWTKFVKTVNHYYRDFSKSSFGKQVESVFYKVHAFVVEKSLIVHRWFKQQWTAIQTWYAKDGEKMFGSFVENVKVGTGMVVEIAKDLFKIVVDALTVFYHRAEKFLLTWQAKGFSKAMEAF